MKLRGALLGAGNIAMNGHAPQWATDELLRREVEIVAIADLSASNLEQARALFPAAAAYLRTDDLLNAETLDFCDICTPPFTHRALIEDAAGRGLHVLCEKPLTSNLADADPIARAVRAAGIVFQPCHQYHYSPDWQVVRGLIPRIGRIHFAEYEVHRTAANEGNAHWSPGWRTDRDFAGGGILVDHGAHIFYQLLGILGAPRTVQATVRTLRHTSYQVEDTALVVLDFDDCLAQISLTWAARRREIQFRFVGERGEIVGDDQGVRIKADTSEQIAFGGGMSKGSSHSDWYAPLFRAFAGRIRSGDRSDDALEEALYVTRLIARAYESSREGRTLPFESTPSEVLGLREAGATDLASPLESAVIAGVPELGAAPVAGEKRRQARLLRVGAAAAVLAAGVWTFHDVAWAPLQTAFGRARPEWILLAAIVNLAAVGCQAARWLALVRPLAPGATFRQAFRSLIVGFAISTIVPARAGELARMQLFSRWTGLTHAAILGSIVLDHLVGATGLLLGLVLLPWFVEVPFWLRPGASATVALFTVGVMAVLLLRPGAGASPASTSAAASPVRLNGVLAFLGAARQGLAAARRPSALGASFGASVVSWVLELNVTAIAFRAVGLELPFAAVCLVLLAVNLALAVPFAPPGNVGTLEVGATLGLMAFGVAKEQALAFALVYHFLQVVPIGILGIFYSRRLAASLREPVRA
jgi:uncharacterized protein (TIRG00374 family)